MALNRGPLVKATVEAHPLNTAPGPAGAGRGALVVDVRTDLQFDEALCAESSTNPSPQAPSRSSSEDAVVGPRRP